VSSAASPAEEVTPKKKPAARRGLPWNRTVHRIGAFFAVLLMLWLACSGITIQVLDLRAVLTKLPPADPTALSIAEGMYGPANFTVIQVRDFDAAAFPGDFDVKQGISTTLMADTETAPIGWVDLRMIDGVPIGQVMHGEMLTAFDARTGRPVASVPPAALPQGRRLPPSLRQTIKTLHRFWDRNDTPGVYVEFFAGLVLWTFLITGLVVYFQLLKARARINRRQLFWLTGGTWRGLHRAVSVLAAFFLVCIAFSGTWIGYESSYAALGRPKPGTSPGAGAPGMHAAASLAADEILGMTTTTLEAMHRLHAGMPIKALRLRTFGQMKQGVVISGGTVTDQFVFNAESGQPASLTEPSYPKSPFPFGVQVHENIKHFHSGELFGLPGQAMNLIAGLSLLFLSTSGMVVYIQMWRARRKSGRTSPVWR
jgi:uncharacterized iron-regulated membrane protein